MNETTILNLYKRYCTEELDIENPTEQDAIATRASHAEQAGSRDVADAMMIRWYPSYTISNKVFTKFEQVVQWVWNTHKIDFDPQGDNDLTEEQKQEACQEMTSILKSLEGDLS